MTIQLTPRMKNWIEAFGVHAAAADSRGYPTVFVSYKCRVDGDKINIPLSDKQVNQISAIIAENPNVSIAPGQLGAVRAPYQFKGTGKLNENELTVNVQRIYCTKPGAEAGLRLDVMGYEDMKEFEESRWHDIDPPGVK